MERRLTVVAACLALCLGLIAAGTAPRTTPEQIEEIGPTQPEWWNDVAAEPPATLQLDWAPSKGWNPRRDMAAYLRDIRNKPALWRPTIKLLHRVVDLNKSAPDKKLRSVRELATAYCLLEGDYVRGAYWYKQAQRLAGSNPSVADAVGLADCYLRLGCTAEAGRELEKVQGVSTRTSGHIRLLGTLGALEKAAAAIQSAAGFPDAATLAAGDAYRYAGRYTEAATYYEQVLTMKQGGRDLKANQLRARENLAAIKAAQGLNLEAIPDGTYEGQDRGYRGPVHVQVVVSNKRIESVKVTDHSENWHGRALTDIPGQIVGKQSLIQIDAVTGATYSSEAILNATCRALAKAGK